MMTSHRFGLLLTTVLLMASPAIAQTDSLKDKPAPSFELPALSGGQVSLQDLRGKIVVLHFGAGW